MAVVKKATESPPRLKYTGPERDFPTLGRVLRPGDLVEYDEGLAEMEYEPGVKLFVPAQSGEGSDV